MQRTLPLPEAPPEETLEVEPASTNKASLKIKGCRVTQVTIVTTKPVAEVAEEAMVKTITNNTNSILIATVSHLSNNNNSSNNNNNKVQLAVNQQRQAARHNIKEPVNTTNMILP